MHLSEDIKPISYLKAKTADVINSVNENHRVKVISTMEMLLHKMKCLKI